MMIVPSVMRSRRTDLLALLVCIALVLTACGRPRPARTTSIPTVGESGPPRITITTPRSGETLRAGDIVVTYSVIGLKLVAPDQARETADVHVDVLLDGDVGKYVGTNDVPVPTGSDRTIHTADTSVTFKSVAPGPHIVTVLVTSSVHVSLRPRMWDSVSVLVQ